MRIKIQLLLLFTLGVISIRAQQQPDGKINREKLNVMQSWAGHWRGEAVTLSATGEHQKAIVAETIQFKLDGTVMLIEGIGKTTQPSSVVHNALAILYYDVRA